jgi:hypothetical protein
MSYLWKKWREAVDAKDWAMANAYADMLDDEREDEKVLKSPKTICPHEDAQPDSQKAKPKPLWLKESD